MLAVHALEPSAARRGKELQDMMPAEKGSSDVNTDAGARTDMPSDTPSVARMYDYFLGGFHNVAIDMLRSRLCVGHGSDRHKERAGQRPPARHHSGSGKIAHCITR